MATEPCWWYCRAEDAEWAETYGDDIAAYFVKHPPVPRAVRVEKLRRLQGQQGGTGD